MPLPPGTRPINQSGIPVEPGVTMILAPAGARLRGHASRSRGPVPLSPLKNLLRLQALSALSLVDRSRAAALTASHPEDGSSPSRSTWRSRRAKIAERAGVRLGQLSIGGCRASGVLPRCQIRHSLTRRHTQPHNTNSPIPWGFNLDQIRIVSELHVQHCAHRGRWSLAVRRYQSSLYGLICDLPNRKWALGGFQDFDCGLVISHAPHLLTLALPCSYLTLT